MTPLIFDQARLTIEDVLDAAHQRRTCVLSDAPDFVQRIEQGARFLDRLLQEDGVIYGVTTGYGDSCTTHIPRDLVEQLPQHLYLSLIHI